MAFKKFTDRYSKSTEAVTITAGYALSFSKKVYDDNNLSQYKYALLYWDKERRMIGVEFTNDEDDPYKFSLIHFPGGGGNITCRSFLKKNNIEPRFYKGKYKYKIEKKDGAKLIVIDLQEIYNNK